MAELNKKRGMIYPFDVHKRVQNSSRVSSEDIARFAFILFIIGSIILFFVLHFVYTTMLGLGMFWVVVTEIAVMSIIGSIVFRMLIFKEDEKLEEYQNQTTDTFAKYVYVRKDAETTLDVLNGKLTCFEYTNGSPFCVLQFKFGSNDNDKAPRTQAVLRGIFHICAENQLDFRTVDSVENFENSTEYANQVRRLNAIPDKKLAKHLLSVAQKALDTCKDNSMVSTLYLVIGATSNYKIGDLEAGLRQIFALILSKRSAFRSINALNFEQLMEFYRDFYGLEVMDLSMMRVIALAEDVNTNYENVVSIYRLEATTGKVYTATGNIKDNFRTESRGISK